MVEANATTAAEAMDSIIGDDFEFDESQMDSAGIEENDTTTTSEVEDAPRRQVSSQKCCWTRSACAPPISNFEPYEQHLPGPLPYRR
jgi:type IV pilus assembly protein PilB